MKPRNTLAQTETRTGKPLELIEHDARFYLESAGTQVDAFHLGHPARELVGMLCRPFRPARKPRIIFLGLGFGHAVVEACSSLPQEKASFVILPESNELASLFSQHLPSDPLDDERVFLDSDHGPWEPIPADYSGSQAIIADLDHLQSMAPKNWTFNQLPILHNLFDTIKAGGLVGLIMSRPDPELEKNFRKCGFEIVTELVPVSEKSKKNRMLYLARKGHYQGHR